MPNYIERVCVMVVEGEGVELWTSRVDPATLVEENETYDIFVGSGSLAYPWYLEVEDDVEDDVDGDRAGWVVRFRNGVGEAKSFDHVSIMRGVWSVAWTPGLGVSKDAVRNARLLLAGHLARNFVDFDADTADQVQQVAVFGSVLFA